ncbi:MAG: DUF1553 domain-containing protein [Bryobacteraceae bacterium]
MRKSFAPLQAVPVLAVLAAVWPAAAAVDFQRDVRVILSGNCFACHGPDSKTRMAGLRLDTREGALAARKSGAAIVPGKPDQSTLIQRIEHADAARRMPPAHSHKTLTDAEKKTLRVWIEEGAPWREHWSFVAPARPSPPAGKSEWARNPIDRFIGAGLEARGLTPAAEADRRTLIRRLSFDLTGLPPTPADVEAFVKDASPEAYETQVERYMNSPRWGEHRARYWLDAARYADTHGIHVDNYREMWPYRDWVISAFNRNMPFDQFTIEQLAGDLLPNRTLDQQIASGFQRCNPTTNEAGVILDEIEAMYAKDRADTTGTVWLGLTVGCATCHDHKFDPISQRDFYSMTAFFRNTTQPIMDGNIPDTPPIIVVPNEEDRDRWASIRDERATLLATMSAAKPDAAFEQWLTGHGPIATPLGNDTRPHMTMAPLLARQPLEKGVSVKPSAYGTALHLEDKSGIVAGNEGWIDSDKPFTVAMWFFYPKRDETITLVSEMTDPPRPKNGDDEDDEKSTRPKPRGWSVTVAGRRPGVELLADRGKGISLRAGPAEQIEAGQWHHIAVAYDGSRTQMGLAIYVDGRKVDAAGSSDLEARLHGPVRAPNEPLLIAGRSRKMGGGAIADFRIYKRFLTGEEAKLVSLWPLLHRGGADSKDALHLYYRNAIDPAYRQAVARLKELDAETLRIRERGAITHVMQEKPGDPMARILYRGMYDQPRDTVGPATPGTLPPMAPSLPRNRLGLAKWLMDANNPLTARVAVNRFWQEVFGTGLVRTSEDFGSQGEPPTHPELLDWLAVEFRESGWDIKHMYRLMVTSAAYRQSATASADKLEKDPDNRYLSRGPRFRLDGELIRDSALAAAGLLAPGIGGPSVKPYQPENVWETVAMRGSNTRFYKPDGGEKLYRRSLYTFWKRSAPPASMEIFNAPTREVCTVRRERTNTPLQALVTMNDVQFVEAARKLAERAMKTGGEFGARLDAMTGLVLARGFDGRERAIAERAWNDYASFYRAHPGDAASLVETGSAAWDQSLDAAELAAYTMLANQILNLDEALNK